MFNFTKPCLFNLGGVCTSVLIIQGALGQTIKDDVGYTALLNQMGASTPNGAGITIGIVEPAFLGKDNPDAFAWLPYPDISDISQVTVIDGSGGSAADSTHAARVSEFLFGQEEGLATGITKASYYNFNDFTFNKLVPRAASLGQQEPSAFLYSLGAKVFENRINNISARLVLRKALGLPPNGMGTTFMKAA